MTLPPTELPFDQALSAIREVAAAHRLESETLALSRCHGRVLTQEVAPANAATSDHNARPAIRRGAVMTPARVALAASLGIPALAVARRPTVAVFTTGDDLVEPGMPLAPGQAYDGNRELLMGLLRAEGLEPTAWPRLPDDRRQIEIALRDAGCAFDLVVICESAASNGNNLVADVVAGFGEIHFHGLRMQFGTPVLFGSLDQARVLGLPVDPTAVLASWLTLGRALVDGLQGRIESRPLLQARLAASIDPPRPWRAFLAARMEVGSNGLQVDPHPSGLPEANTLIVMPEGARHIPVGSIVEVLPL